VQTEKLTNITHDELRAMVIDDESLNVTNNVIDTVTLTTGDGHVAFLTNTDTDNDTDPNDSQDQDTDYSLSPTRREKRSPTNLAPMKPSPSRGPSGRKCCGCPSIPCFVCCLVRLIMLVLAPYFTCSLLLFLNSSFCFCVDFFGLVFGLVWFRGACFDFQANLNLNNSKISLNIYYINIFVNITVNTSVSLNNSSCNPTDIRMYL